MCQGVADASHFHTFDTLLMFMCRGCESANLLMFMLCLLDTLGCNAFTPTCWCKLLTFVLVLQLL